MSGYSFRNRSNGSRISVPIADGLDLRAGRSKTGVVPTTGPGYGKFTSGQPVDPNAQDASIPLEQFESVLNPEQFQALLDAIKRRGNFLAVPFTVDNTTVLPVLTTQPTRYYLHILNRSTLNNLLVGFDYLPTAGNAFEIAAGLGFYEPLVVPTNSITLVGSGGAVSGMLLAAF